MRRLMTYGVIATVVFGILGILNLLTCHRNLFERNDGISNKMDSLKSFEVQSEFKHLLTIFTTFKEIKAIPHHLLARKAVLRNWPTFKPMIKPVVFLNYTNSSFANRARIAGWDVQPITKTNYAGTPCLKEMYRTIFEKYDSMLYGFANGDLLFDEGIIKTLQAIQQKRTELANNVMMTGRRTNVPIDLNLTWTADDFQGERLRKLAKDKGKLIPAYAIDYFFFSKEGCSLNWSSLVDVVIGRVAYDSYLVAMARHQKVNVIDTTKTVLAVHISERNVHSHGRRNPDSLYNAKLIGGHFRHTEGYPTSAKLATTKDFTGDVFIARR